MWVTPDDDLSSLKETLEALREEWNVVVCCTASARRVEGAGEGWYVQGAGDDTENWARGLTATGFWRNRGVLMDAVKDGGGEEAVERVVGEVVGRPPY